MDNRDFDVLLFTSPYPPATPSLPRTLVRVRFVQIPPRKACLPGTEGGVALAHQARTIIVP